MIVDRFLAIEVSTASAPQECMKTNAWLVVLDIN